MNDYKILDIFNNKKYREIAKNQKRRFKVYYLFIITSKITSAIILLPFSL